MLVVEAPRVVEPAVERVDVRTEQLGVVAQAVLDGDAGAREDHRGFDALAVHELDARGRVGGVGVVDVVVVVVGSSPRTLRRRLPGRMRGELPGAADEPERLAVEGHDAVAVAGVVHAERALAVLGRDVALEEIERLVVVVVGVDHPVVDRAAERSSGSGHLPMV